MGNLTVQICHCQLYIVNCTVNCILHYTLQKRAGLISKEYFFPASSTLLLNTIIYNVLYNILFNVMRNIPYTVLYTVLYTLL